LIFHGCRAIIYKLGKEYTVLDKPKTCFIHYIFGTKTSGRIKNAVGAKSKVLKEVL